MIDPRNLAEGTRWLSGQLDAWGIFGAPSTGCADLLAAAKAYQSAVASKTEVEAALQAHADCDRESRVSPSPFHCMMAAITAAKIKINGE